MPPLTKFQKIQQRRTVTPLNVPPATTVAKPVQPTYTQNFGMGSAEGGPVTNSATRTTPVKVVTTPKPAQPDYNTMDLGSLQDELTRYKYRQQSGNFSEDDAVNFNRISRLISDKTLAGNTAPIDNTVITNLEQQREAERIRRQGASGTALEAFKREQQALLAERTRQLEEAGNKQREAAQTATSFSGFGRSTVNVEQQADIEKSKQNAIAAAQAASDLEVQKYQAQLAGADSEVLASYDKQIAAAKGQATQLEQEALANAQKINQEQSAIFGSTLKDLIANSGLKIDVNDEQALAQVINIARNPDGTVNEEVIKGLPASYQAIVRAGVTSGVGKVAFEPKVTRIGGTTKAPVYGYRDPNKGAFVTTNAMGVPTGGSGGGGAGGGGGVGGGNRGELDTRLSRIQDAVNNSNLPLSTVLLTNPDIADDLAYIRNNLSLKSFQEAKKAGVTFGAASNSEWEMLKKSATSLGNPLSSKEATNREINRLRGSTAPAKTTAPTKGTTGVSKYKGRKII